MLSQAQNLLSHVCLTPASTLVISSTLMPANGNVGEPAAAVARLRCDGPIEPLGHDTALSAFKAFTEGTLRFILFEERFVEQ